MDGSIPRKRLRRGLFSERAAWQVIHEDRLSLYREGYDVEEIAQRHNVRREAVYWSLRRSLARMPGRTVDTIKAERWHSRNRWKVIDALLTEYEGALGLLV